jgi:hypothetical protein
MKVLYGTPKGITSEASNPFSPRYNKTGTVHEGVAWYSQRDHERSE